MTVKKCYSVNGEDFNYDEIEEAINDKLSDEFLPTGTVITVYEADAKPHKAGDYADAFPLDTLSSNSWDDGGEYAEDWPNCTSEQGKELETMIADAVNLWADKHGLHPTWYAVASIKEIQVELLDMDGNYKILEA